MGWLERPVGSRRSGVVRRQRKRRLIEVATFGHRHQRNEHHEAPLEQTAEAFPMGEDGARHKRHPFEMVLTQKPFVAILEHL